jgi:hypothetical protein
MPYKTNGSYTHFPSSAWKIQIRCPKCLKNGTFDAIETHDAHVGGAKFGQRRCPNPGCGLHVFVAASGEKILTYPAERIDFDASGIPHSIVTSLTEAITCHANQCYTASALMVRRTLEELCQDQAATGRDLKERIANLGSKIVMPKELLQALDDLRLLGNDAAHIESRTYGQVGKQEVEIGIEFAKEVLKAVYQYSSLLKRLQDLKQTKIP